MKHPEVLALAAIIAGYAYGPAGRGYGHRPTLLSEATVSRSPRACALTLCDRVERSLSRLESRAQEWAKRVEDAVEEKARRVQEGAAQLERRVERLETIGQCGAKASAAYPLF
jgi:hypothetical protein